MQAMTPNIVVLAVFSAKKTASCHVNKTPN